MLFEFKISWVSLLTYSAIWDWNGLVLDCFSLLTLLGIDWDSWRALRMPGNRNSILHFSWFFSNVALLDAPVSNLLFESARPLYVSRKELGLITALNLPPSMIWIFDLIHFENFPKLDYFNLFVHTMPCYEFECLLIV